MVVICAGTSGYNADVDLRFLWTRQKRLQGSHFANTEQCRALNDMVAAGRIDPVLSRVFQFDGIGESHQLMYENAHPPGNMAILVNAPPRGDDGGAVGGAAAGRLHGGRRPPSSTSMPERPSRRRPLLVDHEVRGTVQRLDTLRG